jgi:ATP-dependent RNA helicase DHX57
VGYVIRGESRRTNKTKLLFCTTGVVLRRLSNGDDLSSVTHVIVDEVGKHAGFLVFVLMHVGKVHERSVEGDFLLLELKELLRLNSTLKVVLMSATINHETFVRYFSDAPLLSIPGFTHPITDLWDTSFRCST